MMSIPKEDRELFQLLIEHHSDSTESLAARANSSSIATMRRIIDAFYEKYHCIIRTQVIDWERLGLSTFFTLTPHPPEHPYVIRQFRIVGERVEFLSQWVTPQPDPLPDTLGETFVVSRIYKPANNVRLLHDEARTSSFTEEWLLDLKEVMVDQGMGDLIYQQDASPSKAPIPIDTHFLDRLEKLYLNDTPGRLSHKQLEFIERQKGVIATYLGLKLPGMVDYLLILNVAARPSLFAGGLITIFPIAEVFETANSLICHFQLPDYNIAKLYTTLRSYLRGICTPWLWLLVGDTRLFRLQEQWQRGAWVKLQVR